MRKIIIDGKEITTNYGCEGWNGYPYSNGESKPSMVMKLPQLVSDGVYLHKECAYDMLIRLTNEGYTRITFYETPTRVKGCHDLIAFCK